MRGRPQHVSVHSDVWGDYANPQGFIVQRGFHIRWEDRFVQANVKRAAIAAGMAAFVETKTPFPVAPAPTRQMLGGE
jgi:hypothetical protein